MVLGFDHVLRRLKAIHDQSISKDDVGGTKLIVFMEEDLRPLDSIKVLMVHQVKVGRSEIFIYS